MLYNKKDTNNNLGLDSQVWAVECIISEEFWG